MIYDYQKFFEEKLRYIAQHSTTMLDVGGGKPFQKILSDHRDLLKDVRYTTIDIDPETHPDIVGDAHALPFEAGTFDAVLHIYVFEHLHTPSKAASEIYRVLKPGGYMLAMVPFIHPYHARKEGYRDYWRFSHDGLHVLFGEFKRIELFKVGRYFRAWVGFLPFLWRFRKILEPVAYILDRRISPERSTTAGYIIFAQK